MFPPEFSKLVLWFLGCMLSVNSLFYQAMYAQVMVVGQSQSVLAYVVMANNAALVILLFAIYWYRLAGYITKPRK